jgi:hypothetical protein
MMQLRSNTCSYYALQIVYLTNSGQKLRVHDHPSDQNCHWIPVLKPLAFIMFRDPVLLRSLSQSTYSHDKSLTTFNSSQYAQWVCKKDGRGFLNLLNVLLHVCDLRGILAPCF